MVFCTYEYTVNFLDVLHNAVFCNYIITYFGFLYRDF